MKENKYIDSLFKNKLEENELVAPSGAWDKIDAELNKKNFTINWKWYAGMAASILFLVSSIVFFDQESTSSSIEDLVQQAQEDNQLLMLPPEQMEELMQEINDGKLKNVVVVRQKAETKERNRVNRNFLFNASTMEGEVQYYSDKDVKLHYAGQDSIMRYQMRPRSNNFGQTVSGN